MKYDLIVTTQLPGREDKKIEYNNAEILINNSTQGIMIICGKTEQNKYSRKESKYLPYAMIKRIEGKNPATGLTIFICNEINILGLAIEMIDVMEVKINA